ncbi:MAG TPA: thiolase family protein [Pseudonocardia sp.]|uniref:thiolase family protein n=1 Tax=Pseudonocardia sp. TaxID=60912 RepID=UPI002B4B8D54|nr:thiolase family protein [Pseudonocardia sp.]HLU54675.1 thiolase family protein [Pseudonocardia sp.]
MSAAGIVAAYEEPYARRSSRTTEQLLTAAVLGALDAAGLRPADVDGLGVASFSLAPDHAIDLAWRLGLRLDWIMQDPHGGASGINLLQHAVRAIEAGDARVVVLVAGDHLDRAAFARLTATYNRATAESLTPLPLRGPNALFALLTQRHAAAHGLTDTDYAQIPLAQRRWAARNPGAVYRAPLSLADYLDAPVVAAPLRRFDCVPVVAGADALVLTGDGRGVRVRASVSRHNPDGQEGDGLVTGLAQVADRLWDAAGAGPDDVDLACVYDDYPVMVLVQLADLGCAPDPHAFLHARLARDGWPLNPSGGQLSAGQAGAAGGMHGLVEAVLQLSGRAGERQVDRARLALVTGYGMVLYRYGACANAVVLEGGA